MKTILFLSLVFGCNLIANAHQTVTSSDTNIGSPAKACGCDILKLVSLRSS